jgi:hypothetical protein
MVCPVCRRPVVQPRTGRRRVYCCNAHRQAHWRRRRPLGMELIRDMGLGDVSLLAMLEDDRRAR